MADKKRIDEVGAYIAKYYVPDNDDIKLDKEMRTIFDRITSFREKRAKKKNANEYITSLLFVTPRSTLLAFICFLFKYILTS